MKTNRRLLVSALCTALTMPLSGCSSTVPTELSVSSDSLDFGSVALSESASLSVTVTNTGTSTASLSAPTLGGANAANFSVSTADWPVELEPASSLELDVTFAPLEAGTHVALMTITGDVAGGVSGGGGSPDSSSVTNISVALVGYGGSAGDDDDSSGDDDDSSGDDDDSAPVDSDGDGHATGDDCNDADPAVHPGAEELCDGVDNDCNALVDDDAQDASVWYLDADNDGYGSLHLVLEQCEAPAGYVNNSDDCDDLDPSSYPGGAEVCDGADNNCDNSIDEGVQATFYSDADGDGYGATASPVEGCVLPPGASVNDSDCDDSNPSISPLALELCDGVDNNCAGGIDEGALDASDWYVDADGDGFGATGTPIASCSQPSGTADNDGDCNDDVATGSSIYPNAPELCNTTDDDCDGLIDEDAPGAPVWYLDNDGDGVGGTWLTQQSCTQPAGYASSNNDCDDTDATALPGGTEVCDGADNNCTGGVDEGIGVSWYADLDGDGFGDLGTTQTACFVPTGYVSNSADCDDGAVTISPLAYEICDGLDNNCIGGIDEGALDANDWYLDADGDGFGAIGTPVSACSQPAGTADNDNDCNDDAATGASINPNATELCNSTDDDCDGNVDDGAVDASLWFTDADNDGFGAPGSSLLSCTQPTGAVNNDNDCDDDPATGANINPGAADICDGIDNDCDNSLDEDRDGSAPSCPGTTCATLLSSHPSSLDGLYWLDPGGGDTSNSWEAWCDMTRDNGGWTLVVLNNQSVSDSGNLNISDATQAIVVRGGSTSAGLTGFDLWVGTNQWGLLGTESRLEVGASPTSLAHQAFYTLTLDATDNYRLSMSNPNVTIGTVEPGMATYHSGKALSASDSDNDNYSGSCSTTYGHPWWYGGCWDGSFWGGASGHLEAPYWTSSNTGNAHTWGAIWLR